jgi:uncharacterized protein YraI
MSPVAARASLLILLASLSGCGMAGTGTEVVGNLGEEDFLRLRAGPSLGYSVILGLPEGTPVIRQDCVTELGQLWCRVALADARNIVGYVSADYLTPP